MTTDELNNAIAHCHGNGNWHRGLAMNLDRHKIISTDGVKMVAKKAQAFWLLEAIGSHQSEIRRNAKPQDNVYYVQFWTLTVIL